MAEGSKQIETIETLELTLSDGASAGILKNSSAGVVSGGNTIDISDDTNLSGGDGIALAGDVISADLKANGGLVIESNVLAIDLAASSMTNALAIADTALVAGTNITLTTNTLNVDDAFIKNDASDATTGTLTAAQLLITGDNTTGDTEYVPMVLFGTDSTPPTASNTLRGSIYIEYTA